jgi:hypothetical protein
MPKRRYITSTQRCVISQKSSDLIYIAVEAWNIQILLLFPSFQHMFAVPSITVITLYISCVPLWCFTHPVALYEPTFVNGIVAYTSIFICRFNIHFWVPSKGRTSSWIQAAIHLRSVHNLLDLAVWWINYSNVLSYPSAIWWKFIPP